MSLITDISRQAAKAAHTLALLDTETKNKVLVEMAAALREQKAFIIKENESDLSAARDNNLAASMIDRLTLNDERIEAMAEGIEVIVSLDDPVGQLRDITERPNGIKIRKMRVPLGVVCMIYEARPNVTADAGALCFKSGNVVILRGGSEAVNSNLAIHDVMVTALSDSGIAPHAIQFIPTQDRAAVDFMLRDMGEFIDVVIPRGGKSLIASVQENARIPVMGHLEGICHTYVHSDAELEMAASVILNAKMRRTGICGATETVLIHKSVLSSHAPLIIRLLQEEGCEIRGDEHIANVAQNIIPAKISDWGKEFLSPIVAMRVVESLEEAMEHIIVNGSGHTECIVSSSKEVAQQFFSGLDSAILMHNISTQFADGGEFGLGAEIGIATGKIHARGPVGAAQLVSYKYLLEGNGQVRS